MSLYDLLNEKINECRNEGEVYFMCSKPYNRRIIINPMLVKDGNNLFVMSPNRTLTLNVLQFDEYEVGVTTPKFYMKYDHKGNLVKE